MVVSEETLQTLFQELGDGICAVGRGGRILFINSAARRMLGLSETAEFPRSICQTLCAPLAGKTHEDFSKTCPLLHDPEPGAGLTLEGNWPHMTYEWSGFQIQKHEKKSQLRVRCLRWPNHPFGQSAGEVHLVMIQDVTRELEIREHKEEWREMAAHDLRAPLTNVFGSLRVLQDIPEGRPLEKGERQLLEIGVRSCRRMIELLDLYLAIAKLDASMMPVDIKELDLLDEVWMCVEEQAPLIKERGVKMTIDVEDGFRVRADRDLFERVLHNLVNNAVKFSAKGGEVTISARREADGGMALCVEDRGPGIPADDLPLIFDRFHQAKARQQGKTQGTGLGLTYCREAMRAMQGNIRVESKPGTGSRFFLLFPPPGGKS